MSPTSSTWARRTISPAYRATFQFCCHALADAGSARVEPHDSVMQGLARVAVPQQHRLPLVGDANREDVDLCTRWGKDVLLRLLRLMKQQAHHRESMLRQRTLHELMPDGM